jgi:hypothetical protein
MSRVRRADQRGVTPVFAQRGGRLREIKQSKTRPETVETFVHKGRRPERLSAIQQLGALDVQAEAGNFCAR